jgi:hypothetical protein
MNAVKTKYRRGEFDSDGKEKEKNEGLTVAGKSDGRKWR